MTQKPVNKPTHEIFNVLGDGENAQWTKIGVAWTHKDGEGLNLAINCIPVEQGNTVIRKIKEKAETKPAKKKAA